MGTHSTIGMRNDDFTVTTIMCWYDGYFEGVGHTLAKYYTNEESVRKLIKGGDLVSLSDTPEHSKYWHRDKGEKWRTCKPIKTIVSYDEVEDITKTFRAEWNYIFDHGTWMCYHLEYLKEPDGTYAPYYELIPMKVDDYLLSAVA